MATYKCLQSGNTVTFTQQHDIDSMRGHAGYVLVDALGEQTQAQEAGKALPMTAPTPVKRMGRPRKAVETI